MNIIKENTGNDYSKTMNESMTETVLQVLAEIDTVKNVYVPGNYTRTGYEELDNITGGLKHGCLTMLASLNDYESTVFALNIASNISIRDNGTVLFISSNRTKKELIRMLLCAESHTEISRVLHENLEPEERAHIDDAVFKLINSNLRIECTMGENNILSICELMGSDADLIIIDNLEQLYLGENYTEERDAKGRSSCIQEGIANIGNFTNDDKKEILEALHEKAIELNVPILLLNRLEEKKAKDIKWMTRISTIQNDSYQENTCDELIYISTDSSYMETEGQIPARLDIAKQPLGMPGEFNLVYMPEYCKFVEQPVSEI